MILQVLEEEVTHGSARYWPLGCNVIDVYVYVCVLVYALLYARVGFVCRISREQ